MLYTREEALNYPVIPRKWSESIVVGHDETCRFISNLISRGTESRKKTSVLALDGFLGVEWKSMICRIEDLLKKRDLDVKSIDITSCYKSPREIERMVKPCLVNDPSFGSVFKGRLKGFFDATRLQSLKKEIKNYKRKELRNCLSDVVICYGTGAVLPSLRGLYDFIFYIDITREELVKRCEKKTAFPLGSNGDSVESHLLSKRLTYVDYQILRIHKKYVLKHMDYYLEANIPEKPKLLCRDTYDGILSVLAQYPFRLKPVYIPRIWGGQYLKKVRKLPKSMPGCAFSVEVSPSSQNVKISVGKSVLEIPFLNLIWNQPREILGSETVRKFGEYFPLTVNYDDTYQDGSLAIQVHPNGTYMKKNFNELMRHDEIYYVVKAWQGAKTYHGLREETDLEKLRHLCERAEKKRIPFNHDLHINSWPSKDGDLFLLPAGTIHASDANQLVLEIDFGGTKNGTEYTFHLYDYLRLDLDGNLRAIHLDHSFNVIRVNRRAGWVARHLKQPPRLIRRGTDWAEYLLGERKDMCYKVHRLEFKNKIDDNTRGKFHMLTLVEGDSVIIRSQRYPERQFKLNYTETVIVPACLGAYSIINLKNGSCKLTKGFLK